MDYCKVLIFGQTFNDKYGGGITLTNLFKGWPREKIAVADTGHMMYDISTEVCDTYYQLGIEEFKWRFPFVFFQRKFPSGLKSINDKSQKTSVQNKPGFRHTIVNNVFYPALRWSGLFHCVSNIEMSSKFKNWISDFNPDVLYIQAATRETVLFATQLVDYLRIPAAIHFMDDWPSTISSKGLFKDFWKAKIDEELKILLNRVVLHLSISDSMSEEYKKRYGKDFKAFHNPIDTELWLPYTKKNFSIEKENVKILCSGRIGHNGIGESLVEVASAIDTMNGNKLNIKLHIQTPAIDKGIHDQLSKFSCVFFNQIAEYSQIPKIFSDADILLLANDFNHEAIKYLKYSMPTKASEYMISGAPILVYTPEQAAVSGFFSKNGCGLCVSRQNKEEIIKAITYLIDKEDYRKEISGKSVQLARDKFDASKVRKQFHSLLSNLKNN